jgi:hypothetical protein
LSTFKSDLSGNAKARLGAGLWSCCCLNCICGVKRRDLGVMSQVFVFYGDGSGAVVAADAKDGKLLWHFNTGQQFKGSPMAYTIDGKERLVLIAGQTVLSFGIR